MSLIKTSVVAFAVAAVYLICTVQVQAGSIDVNNGTYRANWTVENSTITVEVTAKTLGYIGFGINQFPNMTGADLFIGGVDSNGTYGWDYHGVGNRAPVLDDVQNYAVLSASESNETTTITFRRPLVTGDADDVNIVNSEQYILWSIGSNDTIQHHAQRGAVQVNILGESSNATAHVRF